MSTMQVQICIFNYFPTYKMIILKYVDCWYELNCLFIFWQAIFKFTISYKAIKYVRAIGYVWIYMVNMVDVVPISLMICNLLCYGNHSLTYFAYLFLLIRITTKTMFFLITFTTANAKMHNIHVEYVSKFLNQFITTTKSNEQTKTKTKNNIKLQILQHIGYSKK